MTLLDYLRLCCLTGLCLFGFTVGIKGQTETLEVMKGSQLSPGFAMGVNSSHGNTGWLEDRHGFFRMSYPANESWGAVFVTVGPPVPPARRNKFRDLSSFRTLAVEMRGESGGEAVDIGIKTNTDPDNGSETKIPATLAASWKTYEFALERFTDEDLKRIYVVIEFVFGGAHPQTVEFRNIRYLTRPAK